MNAQSRDAAFRSKLLKKKIDIHLKILAIEPADKIGPASLENIKGSLETCIKSKDMDNAFQLLQGLNPVLLRQGLWDEGVRLNEDWRCLAVEPGNPASDAQQADVAYWLGIFHDEMKNREPAEIEIGRSLGYAQRLQDADRQARAYHRQGWLAHQQKDYATAEQRYRQAEACWQAAEGALRIEGLARVLHHRGILAFDQGHLDEARRLLLASLEQRQQIGDRWLVVASLHHLGHVAARQDDWEQAIKYYLECQLIRKEIHDWPGLEGTYYQLGLAYYTMENLSQAKEQMANIFDPASYYDPMQEQPTTYRPQPMLPEFLSGMIAWKERDFPEAQNHLEEALRWATAAGNQHYQALANYQLGLVEDCQNRPASAAACFEKSAAIFRETKELEGYVNALYQWGVMEIQLDQFDSAEQKLKESLEIYQKAGRQWHVAQACLRLGFSQVGRNDFAQAARWFQQSVEIWKALGATDDLQLAQKWLQEARRRSQHVSKVW